MPRDKNKRPVEAQLNDVEYELFSKDAADREWSRKKLNEIIIRAYLKLENKDEFLKLGRKER